MITSQYVCLEEGLLILWTHSYSKILQGLLWFINQSLVIKNNIISNHFQSTLPTHRLWKVQWRSGRCCRGSSRGVSNFVGFGFRWILQPNLCLGQVEHGEKRSPAAVATTTSTKPGLWGFVLLLWPSHWPSRVPDVGDDDLWRFLFSAATMQNSQDLRIAGSKIPPSSLG